MLTVNFYKIANRWYLDNPEYVAMGGTPDSLECIGSLADLLELAAAGKSAVQLVLHTEPFEGADEAVLTNTSGEQSGAYYHVTILNGQEVEAEVWVNQLIYYYYPELPKKIYGKFA